MSALPVDIAENVTLTEIDFFLANVYMGIKEVLYQVYTKSLSIHMKEIWSIKNIVPYTFYTGSKIYKSSLFEENCLP